MTACPIRYQRQVPDRKGKIFYTSITSLSHISKIAGHEAAYGRRRRSSDRNDTGSPACEPVLVNSKRQISGAEVISAPEKGGCD